MDNVVGFFCFFFFCNQGLNCTNLQVTGPENVLVKWAVINVVLFSLLHWVHKIALKSSLMQ